MHKSIHYHLHCIGLIRRSIPFPIAVNIDSSYLLPQVDYCNNLLFNLPAYKLIKLQRQNAVVRCVHLLPRRSLDSITPLLRQLQFSHGSHETAVSYRIKYKLSLTIHKAIYHNSPIPILPSPSTHTHYSNTHPILIHLSPYYTPTTQPPFLPYTLLCPICPLSLKLTTLPPSNNDINLILQISSKYILFIPCFPPNTIISPT